MAMAFWLYYRLRLVTTRVWGLAGLVCFWIGYEYLNQTWDLNFPWMTLGNGLAVAHQWIQWYEYTGVYGGTLWIWLLNIFAFLIYTGLREGQGKQLRLKLVSAFVIILILPLSWSLVKYHNYTEQSNPSNIVVVQPNIDPYGKVTTIPPYQQVNILTRLSDSLGQANTEFFIWPETALPDWILEDNIRTNALFLQAQHFLSKFKNGNIITGVETYKIYNYRATPTASPYPPQPGTFYDVFNAATNIENSAEVQFSYKSKLVPGAESLPFSSALSFLKPAFEHLGGASGNYGTQPDAKVFYSQGGIGIDPVICYESIWGDWIAESVHRRCAIYRRHHQ